MQYLYNIINYYALAQDFLT